MRAPSRQAGWHKQSGRECQRSGLVARGAKHGHLVGQEASSGSRVEIHFSDLV